MARVRQADVPRLIGERCHVRRLAGGRVAIAGLFLFACGGDAVAEAPSTLLAVSLSASASQTCIVATDGRVWCWGVGDASIASAGGSPPRTTPTLIDGVHDAVEVACGAGHACARTRSGSVLCWGNNDVGQLGDGLPEHERCNVDGQAFDCARTESWVTAP